MTVQPIILENVIMKIMWKLSNENKKLWQGKYDFSFFLWVQNRVGLELVSKELNHLAAILHVYAGGFNFMK